MTPPVTTVTTRAASSDRLTPADYHDIYQEVRGYDPTAATYRISLRAFVDLIRARLPDQETLSIGYWSKYHTGQLDALNRRARNELRALVGYDPLPPTVAEATATADPDATVYQVGQAPADRIVLVGSDVADPLDLRINGHLTAEPGASASSPVSSPQAASVTPVTAPRSRKPTRAIRLSPDRFERLSALRKEAGLTWDELADWIEVLCGELGVEQKQ